MAYVNAQSNWKKGKNIIYLYSYHSITSWCNLTLFQAPFSPVYHSRLYLKPFLEPGVKTDGNNYQNTVLAQVLQLKLWCISGEWYIF